MTKEFFVSLLITLVTFVVFVLIVFLLVKKLFKTFYNLYLAVKFKVQYLKIRSTMLGKKELSRKSYKKEIETEINSFKNNIFGIAKRNGFHCVSLKFLAKDYYVLIHKSGVFAVRVDDTSYQIRGFADEKAYSVIANDNYGNIANPFVDMCRIFPNIVSNITKTVLPKCCFHYWVVHTSYSDYRLLPATNDNFRHLNTQNFESFLKEYAQNTSEYISKEQMTSIADGLVSLKGY